MFSDDENCNVVKLIAALAYTYKSWMGSEFRHISINIYDKVHIEEYETTKEQNSHFHCCIENGNFTPRVNR